MTTPILSPFGKTLTMLSFTLICLCVKSETASQSRLYRIDLYPSWDRLDSMHQALFDNTMLILACKLVFKKKINTSMHLEKLSLHWKGSQPLAALNASLFRRGDQQSTHFAPLEENFICDGTWNQTDQTLEFFTKNEPIRASSTFYLVFSINQKEETLLKSGAFILVPNCILSEEDTPTTPFPLKLAFNL